MQDSEVDIDETVRRRDPEQPANLISRQGSKLELHPSEDAVLMSDSTEQAPGSTVINDGTNNQVTTTFIYDILVHL